MRTWLRNKNRIGGIAILVILPIICGLIFLGNSAPRDWSLHWQKPQTLIAAMSGGDYAAAPTPRGWDALWIDPNGGMRLSRFDRAGTQLGNAISLRGTPLALTLGHAGTMDVAIWRQDTANGSQLQAAIIPAHGSPEYRILASGTGPLEHPQAFTAGSSVDVVFSWQHSVFDVYLSRIAPGGRTSPPVQLTHVHSYAFNPHAVVDSSGDIRLLYMEQCCNQAGFYMMTSRYTPDGRQLGASQRIDTIQSVGSRGSGATPDQWGLDVQSVGTQIWGVWAGDSGLALEAWHGKGVSIPAQVIVPGIPTQKLKLAASGGHISLVWELPGSTSTDLETLQLGADGLPTSQPDRIAFEAASDQAPTAVPARGVPAVIFQSAPSKSRTTSLEVAVFSSGTLGAPNVWTKLGLGLANPIGSLIVLIVTAVALGMLLAVGNVLLVFAFVLLYFIAFRIVPQRWKWYAYLVVLAQSLYWLFVSAGAPNPPLLFMTNLSPTLGLVAAGGLVIFVAVLTRTFLQRIDDLYRIGMMTFAAVYFIAFLQALTTVQGSIGSV